jgi:SAM-dependent methyltransferase
VTAVDNAPAAVAACEARRAPGASHVTYLLADATALPFPAGAFDIVVDKATLDVRCVLLAGAPRSCTHARICRTQSLDCIGAGGAAAAETWRVLAAGGLLVSLTCRDASERDALLARWFEPAAPRRDVWAERNAPCPTYAIALLRRRDAPHDA